jgi:hypothetical protein
LSARAQRGLEAQRRIGSDATRLLHDLVHALDRHSDRIREVHLGDAERSQEFLELDLTIGP